MQGLDNNGPTLAVDEGCDVRRTALADNKDGMKVGVWKGATVRTAVVLKGATPDTP